MGEFIQPRDGRVISVVAEGNTLHLTVMAEGDEPVVVRCGLDLTDVAWLSGAIREFCEGLR